MMRKLIAVRMRILAMLNREAGGDFDAELTSHIAMHTDDGIRSGLAPEEARRRALIRLGGAEQTRQAYREQRVLHWAEMLLVDMRYGFRTLRRNPGFATVAVLSLALGIGATTAMFSLIYAVLLHPFPYAGADRIMNPTIIDQQHPDDWSWFGLSWAQLDELRQAAPVDTALGFNGSQMEITSGGLPEEISGMYLTENAGNFFGVRPLHGRNLEPSDAQNGGHPVVVLNYHFWQRHFSGDPDVVGQTLEINHAPFVIVGVMPRSFAFNDTTGVADVYLPGSLMRGVANLPYLAYLPWIKLRPGVTLAAANAALEPIVREFAKEHPDRFPDHWHLALQPVIVPYQQETGRPLTLLLAGVVLLLIIGCTNAAILMLARGRSRQQELALRRAIGATRWRIARQLLVEAVVISFTGSVLGLAASYWLARLPLLLSPDSFPAESVVRINGPVLAFSVSLALLSGILFGLVPAWRLSSQDSGRLPGKQIGTAIRPTRQRWSPLIAAQIALTLVVMATAGTAIRGFMRLMQVPLGYDPASVLKLGIMLHTHDKEQWNHIRGREARTAYIEQIRDKVASIPGVVAVAACVDGMPPYTGTDRVFNLDEGNDHTQPQARVMMVGQRYFDSLRIPFLQGHPWSAEDNARGDFVAVVNRAFVARYFASSNPLNRQIRLPGLEVVHNTYTVTSRQSNAWRQIIGVVGDVRNDGLDRPVVPAIYLPYTAVMPPYAQLFVRTQGDPMIYLRSIRTAIASIAPDQEISHGMFNATITLNDALEHDAQYSRQRLFSVLFGVFSAIALALALVGIFSVVAYSVAQRTTEFGVRLALGATRAHVLWVAVRIAVASAAMGIVIGLVASGFLGALLAHWMQSAFGADSLFAAAGLLALSAMLASLLPARHAIAVEPAEALRRD